MPLLLAAFLMASAAWAEIGRVTKIADAKDAYLVRDSVKTPLAENMPLEINDEIFSSNSQVLLHLYPGTQTILSKNSQIKLSASVGGGKSLSFIELNKGIILVRVTVDKDQEIEQKVQTEGASFTTAGGAEYEISIEGEKAVDLDVSEGEVTVSSPYVHTFVPEVVKAKEGFSFSRKGKSFSRRDFSPKLKDDPAFESPSKIKARWKNVSPKKKTGTDKRDQRKN